MHGNTGLRGTSAASWGCFLGFPVLDMLCITAASPMLVHTVGAKIIPHYGTTGTTVYRLQPNALLQDAVRFEHYGEAARLKAQLQVLLMGDAVASVQHGIAEALKEERYGDAAKLRDEGLAGLQGWWAGCAEDDPVGHLLHVQAEYGR